MLLHLCGVDVIFEHDDRQHQHYTTIPLFTLLMHTCTAYSKSSDVNLIMHTHATYMRSRKLDETIERIEKETKANDKKTLEEVRVAECMCYLTFISELNVYLEHAYFALTLY
jgi:hypothetical protein